jgi:hypothetical protein
MRVYGKLAQMGTVEYYYGCSHTDTPSLGAHHPRFAVLVYAEPSRHGEGTESGQCATT